MFTSSPDGNRPPGTPDLTPYKDLLEALPDAVLLIDQAGRIAQANHLAAQLLGWSDADLLGWQIVRALIAPEDQQRAACLIPAGIPAEKAIGACLNLRLLRADGSRVLVEAHISILQTAQQRYKVASLHPSTQRPPTGQTSLPGDELLRQLVASSDDILFTLDTQQRHTSIFGRSITNSGLTETHFLGRSARDLFGPQQAEPHEQAGARALRGEHVVYEWSSNGPRGIEYFQTSLSPMYDAQGQVVGIAGIGHNITTQKKAQIAMREMAEQYSTMLFTTTDGFLVVDHAGRIFDVNEAYCRMSGYSRAELLYMTIADLEAAENAEAIAQRMQSIEAGTLRFETRHHTRDGRVIDIEVSSTYIPSRQQFFSFLHDISERKQAAEQLHQALSDKETLLRELYHRVKNNMQVISAMFDLQQMFTDDPHLTSILNDMSNRIRSMALVHQKLYQSRNLTTLDLGEYIQELAGLLVESYTTGARPELLIHVSSIPVALDTALPCGQVLNELISNALKYAFPAGRQGQITVDLQQQPDGMIHLLVADNGVGLPAGFQVRQDSRLGLQTVIALVEHQLRGSFTFTNNVGAGLTCRAAFYNNYSQNPRV